MNAEEMIDVQEALRRLECGPGHLLGGAQRRFQRFPVRCEARLCPGGSDASQPPVPVQIRDISRGGVGLLSSQQMPVSQIWQLQIVVDNVTVATLPTFCRFCHQVAEGVFLIGAEFGIDAGIIISLGVTAKELAGGDAPEKLRPLAGQFVDPDSLLGSPAL